MSCRAKVLHTTPQDERGERASFGARVRKTCTSSGESLMRGVPGDTTTPKVARSNSGTLCPPLCHRYVLWKERNMLYTEREFAKSKKIPFKNPARIKKVSADARTRSGFRRTSTRSGFRRTSTPPHPTPPELHHFSNELLLQVRTSMARLKFVWDERLKAYYNMKDEATQAEIAAQAAKNKVRSELCAAARGISPSPSDVALTVRCPVCAAFRACRRRAMSVTLESDSSGLRRLN